MKKYTYLEVKQMCEKFDNGEITQEEFDTFIAGFEAWFNSTDI